MMALSSLNTLCPITGAPNLWAMARYWMTQTTGKHRQAAPLVPFYKRHFQKQKPPQLHDIPSFLSMKYQNILLDGEPCL